MAHMIPATPKEYSPESKEGYIFNILKDGLDDDYYVFHSVHEVEVSADNFIYEREMDFVIANQNKGVLCIEAKAGRFISYHDRNWYYSSGQIMDHDGPYNQIDKAKLTLMNKVKNHKNPAIRQLYKKCRFLHAVLFVDVSRNSFESFTGLPEEASLDITIFNEDLKDIQKKIESIYELRLPWEKYQQADESMTKSDLKLLLDYVLCPYFNMVPSPSAKHAIIEESMNQLLKEQYKILDFLDEQNYAVINGSAGTGKTMIAVEKARRHSLNNEKVLFLCYNKMLCDNLISRYSENKDKTFSEMYSNVDFMTISKLAYEKTGDFNGYEKLLEWLLNCVDKKEELGYKHIIVDEGQDFGLIDEMVSDEASSSEDNCSIIDALQEAALENGGTFYLFYDKYQMIQGRENANYNLPDCIENCDCRLTLHTNCRNTEEIARTSLTPIKDKKNRSVRPKAASSWIAHSKPVLHLVNTAIEGRNALNHTIDKLVDDGLSDIVILSVYPLEYSSLKDVLRAEKDGFQFYVRDGKPYRVTTCKKFKGLEADAVIIIDIDSQAFLKNDGMRFYVGSSRAKQRLDCICRISESEYEDVVRKIDPRAPIRKNNPERMRNVLGSLFSAEIITE